MKKVSCSHISFLPLFLLRYMLFLLYRFYLEIFQRNETPCNMKVKCIGVLLCIGNLDLNAFNLKLKFPILYQSLTVFTHFYKRTT